MNGFKNKKSVALLLILLAFSGIVEAQTENYILYREYEPDYWIVLNLESLHDEKHFDVNIDDDENYDVRYSLVGEDHWPSDFISTINGWQVCSLRIPSTGQYLPNEYRDPSIPLNDSSLVWGSRCIQEEPLINPNATNPLVFKAALRCRVSENFYYGWAEFEVYGDYQYSGYGSGHFHVAKTCYCAIPNYPLIWGQTSLTEDIEELRETSFATFHPNPTNGLVTITGNDLKQAQIINTLGQCVAMVKGEGEQLTVDISNLPTGVYFVNITDGEGRKCVKKVMKE